MSDVLTLLALALMHALVDASALLVAPLWPGIEEKYQLGAAGLSAAFIVQSLPTNVSQVIFGWLRDRQPMPAWIWIGPLIAAVSLPLMGFVETPALLFLLLTLGGIGVGSFHPEAAVAAGRALPEARTRAISIFMLGGSLGMTMGPLLSGTVVSRYGLKGLAWLAIPLCLGVFLLQRVGRLGATVKAERRPSRADTGAALSGRWGLTLGLLGICSLRLVPNMAMDKVIAYLLAERGADAAEIGRMQSIFLASASAGMILMAVWFRGGREKTFLVVTPLLSIPLLALLSLPGCPAPVFVIALVIHGIVLWGTTPAMVSYAQQQFPQGAGFASALTMGLSWGVAGLIQAPITVWFRSQGAPGQALLAFIPCLVVSAMGAVCLPTVGPRHSATSSGSSGADRAARPAELFPEPGIVSDSRGKSVLTAEP